MLFQQFLLPFVYNSSDWHSYLIEHNKSVMKPITKIQISYNNKEAHFLPINGYKEYPELYVWSFRTICFLLILSFALE